MRLIGHAKRIADQDARDRNAALIHTCLKVLAVLALLKLLDWAFIR